ncbi:MAG: DUF2818 family protein, partial [Nitrosomonadales bacterium]|nr:DUF2818 family protein [Nitrosomonadales bacterium]MBT7689960.1 DUF2818 family protein [Nitrosomonadales bacterium]
MIFILIIILALFLANIPWLSNNLFIFFPQNKNKAVSFILIEIIV